MKYPLKLKTIFGTLAIAVLATATWLTLSGAPLALRLNRWQAGLMGSHEYYPALTIFILALPPLLVLAGIKLLLQRAGK